MTPVEQQAREQTLSENVQEEWSRRATLLGTLPREAHEDGLANWLPLVNLASNGAAISNREEGPFYWKGALALGSLPEAA